jgi:hypothetical protein
MNQALWEHGSMYSVHLAGRDAVRGVFLVAGYGPVFGSMQFRYFGKRPMIEDNSVQPDNTMSVNGQIGIKIDKKLRVAVQMFNLLGHMPSTTSTPPGYRVSLRRVWPTGIFIRLKAARSVLIW